MTKIPKWKIQKKSSHKLKNFKINQKDFQTKLIMLSLKRQ